jgi:lipid A 3-O-deacylase
MASLATPVHAQSRSLIGAVKLGVLAHDVPDLWSGFELEGGRAALNLEVQLRAFGPLLGGTLAPVVGGSLAFGGDATSSGYAGLRWEIGGPAGLFLGLGLGGAVHDGRLTPTRVDRKALGSRVLFHIPAEIGWRFENGHTVSLFFEHMSNAGLADHNEGLDRLGLRYGVRF